MQIEIVLQPFVTDTHQDCQHWGNSCLMVGNFKLSVEQVEGALWRAVHPPLRAYNINEFLRVKINPVPNGFPQGYCDGDLRLLLHAEQKR